MKKDKIYNICVWWLMIDQIIKILITMKMKLYQKVIIIPNFFKIYYVRNDGAAFSSLSGQKYFLIVIGIVVFLFMVKYIKSTKITKKLEVLSLGMIMGGLVGNLIDRLLYGEVIDYLSFTIFGYPFAIFNFADIGIVIGIILLIFNIVKEEQGNKKNPKIDKKKKK